VGRRLLWSSCLLELGGSSFHSISFPSEWKVGSDRADETRCYARSDVSIQLVSPASGEPSSRRVWISYRLRGFHSISFPSEWGVSSTTAELSIKCNYLSFHSISFPNEWGASRNLLLSQAWLTLGFHSISFPNEWGAARPYIWGKRWQTPGVCFHSISFPNEWGDLLILNTLKFRRRCFHSISFPSEWGEIWKKYLLKEHLCFHSISFPSEWGVFLEVFNHK
jgi:hypothetical protein